MNSINNITPQIQNTPYTNNGINPNKSGEAELAVNSDGYKPSKSNSMDTNIPNPVKNNNSSIAKSYAPPQAEEKTKDGFGSLVKGMVILGGGIGVVAGAGIGVGAAMLLGGGVTAGVIAGVAGAVVGIPVALAAFLGDAFKLNF